MRLMSVRQASAVYEALFRAALFEEVLHGVRYLRLFRNGRPGMAAARRPGRRADKGRYIRGTANLGSLQCAHCAALSVMRSLGLYEATAVEWRCETKRPAVRRKR
jgi:hypothetical protein